MNNFKWSEQEIEEALSKAQKDFKEYYLGEWKLDQRTIDLQEKIYEFYNEYSSVGDFSLYKRDWNDLKYWVQCNGYTWKEFNEAKRVVKGWRLDGE